MPYSLDYREEGGIVQSYIAAKNLPVDVTVEKLIQLFDAVGTVANVKLMPICNGSRTAIIVYYSDDTARRALEELEGNDSLKRSSPLELEYFGPLSMKDVELELERRERMLRGLNGFLDELL